MHFSKGPLRGFHLRFFSALKKSGYALGTTSNLGSQPLVIMLCFDYDFDFINHFSIVAFPETKKS